MSVQPNTLQARVLAVLGAAEMGSREIAAALGITVDNASSTLCVLRSKKMVKSWPIRERVLVWWRA